jgi:hypothetical protein
MSRKKLSLTKRKKIVIGLLVLLSATLSIALFSISAASGQIPLKSSTSSVVQGKTFTVDVNVSSDAPINVGHSKVTYDPSALSLQGISYAGTPFTTDSPEAANGSGSVTISRYKLGPPYPTGNFKLATLTFRANSASGNTTLGVSQTESYLYDESAANALTSVSGVTVALTKPPLTNPTPNPAPNFSIGNPAPTPPSNDGSPRQTESNNPQPISDGGSSDTGNDAEPALITESTPDDMIPAPGTSRRSSNIGIAARLSLIVRNVLPVIVVLGVLGVAGWVLHKKFGRQSHLTPFKPAQAGGPTVVFDGSHTVKTNDDQGPKPPLSPIQ